MNALILQWCGSGSDPFWPLDPGWRQFGSGKENTGFLIRTIEADSVNSMSRTFTLEVVLRRLLNGLPSVEVGPVDVCIHCIPQSFEEEPILGRFVRHVWFEGDAFAPRKRGKEKFYLKSSIPCSRQCCGSASLWCGSGSGSESSLKTLMRIRIFIWCVCGSRLPKLCLADPDAQHWIKIMLPLPKINIFASYYKKKC